MCLSSVSGTPAGAANEFTALKRRQNIGKTANNKILLH